MNRFSLAAPRTAAPQVRSVGAEQTHETSNATGLVQVPRESLDVLQRAVPVLRRLVTAYYLLIEVVPQLSRVKLKLHGGTGARRDATVDPTFWYEIGEQVNALRPRIWDARATLAGHEEWASSVDAINGRLEQAQTALEQLSRDGGDPATEPAKEPLRLITEAENMLTRVAQQVRAVASDRLDDLVLEATRLAQTMGLDDSRIVTNTQPASGWERSETERKQRDAWAPRSEPRRS